jgi:pimeloyl-ACP methyl ester carboxylesterase
LFVFVGLLSGLMAFLSGNSQAAPNFHSPIVTPFATEFDPHEHAYSRSYVKSLIWPQQNPVDRPDLYPIETMATSTDTFEIKYEFNQINLSSRIKEWVPTEHRNNCFAIYHEGHAPDSQRTPEGLATVNFLTAQGCHTFYVDMPLRGLNEADQIAGLTGHSGFDSFPWPRNYHQLSVYLEPVAHLVDRIYTIAEGEPYIIMAGRSGGGWATLWYSALDPRIDTAIIIAGFWPQSMRLRPTLDNGLIKTGDYEQSVKSIYDYVSYEDLVNLLRERKAIALYSTFDPCCFNTPLNDPYATWLSDRIDMHIDPFWGKHGLSPAQYDYLAEWLSWHFIGMPLILK